MKIKPCHWSLRGISLLLAVVVPATTMPSFVWAAAESSALPVANVSAASSDRAQTEARTIKPRRITAPAGPIALGPKFSAEPTPEEVFQAHVFLHPLVPVGVPTPAETKAIADALTAYVKRTDPHDHSVLIAYLKQYPKSAWPKFHGCEAVFAFFRLRCDVTG